MSLEHSPARETVSRPKMRTPAAAAYIGCSESTLEKKRVTGTGPRYIKIGRVVLYDPPDLDMYIDEHKRRSTSEPARGAA